MLRVELWHLTFSSVFTSNGRILLLTGDFLITIKGEHKGDWCLTRESASVLKNMTEEEKKLAVEKDLAEAAAAKAKADAEANEPSELEKQLAAKDAELEKIREERDNYKRGMLKAKGKPSEGKEDDLEEDEEARVRRIVREEQMQSKESQIINEKDTLLKQAIARNKELETAIKNRSQLSTTGTGSSNGTTLEPTDPILSKEQIADFKAKGWDDAKIELYKKNYMRVR